MMSPEENRVLASLRCQPLTTLEDLARACGQSAAHVARVLSHLEWSGQVVVYRDRAGYPGNVQFNARSGDPRFGTIH
jgi:DNA-binding MarR family transcriptional regulator